MTTRSLFYSTIVSISLAGLAAGVLTAQAPQPRAGGRQQMAKGPGGMGMGMGGLLSGPNVEKRLTNALTLDATQQNAVHTALAEADLQRKGLPEKSRDLRSQMNLAIKAGDQGKIDTISRDLAALNQQETALDAKTLSKIYGTLNADQKSKLDSALSRGAGGPGPRGRQGGQGAPKQIQ